MLNDDKKSFGRRIDKAIKESGLQKKEIADRLGVKPQAVTGWIKNGSISRENLSRLSELTGKSLLWLLGEDNKGLRVSEDRAQYSVSNAAATSLKIDEYPDDEPPDSPEFVMLDEIAVGLSAGNGHEAHETEVVRRLPFRQYTLNEAGVKAADALVHRVIGNSMEPLIKDGDIVAINTADTGPIRDGKIYAFRDVDMIRVKLLYRVPGGGLRIRSLNSAEYPDEVLSTDEANERITIIGRAFWLSKML